MDIKEHCYHSIWLLSLTVLILLFRHQQSIVDVKMEGDELESTLIERYRQKLGNLQTFRAFRIKQKLCSNGKNCQLVPPFVEYESRQMIAPSFGISSCVIYKNFSTVMTSIMCYLYDIIGYRKDVTDLLADTYGVRRCRDLNEFYSHRVHSHISPKNTNKWTKYVITREPMERFISGFVNKCLQELGRDNPCYNCGSDIECVMNEQYKSLLQYSTGKRVWHTMEDAHFAPQTWHCEMRSNWKSYNFIPYSGGQTETMLNDLLGEFEYRGVPKNVTTDIRKQVLGGRTFHATYHSPLRKKYEQMIQKSSHLKELLVKMFYYDYILLGYPFPKF